MGKGVWGVSVPKMALVLLPKMALNLQIKTYPGNRLHAKHAFSLCSFVRSTSSRCNLFAIMANGHSIDLWMDRID